MRRFTKPRHVQRRHQPPGERAVGWEPVAGWYRAHLKEEGSLLRSVVYPDTLRLLAPVRGGRYLDVACGEGSFAQLVAKAGGIVTGIDASAALIRTAERKRVPHATFQVMDARSFADRLSGGAFAGATCLLAIQNIAPFEPVFQHTARVLAPGASFVVVMNHPMFRIPRQSAWGWDAERKLQYRRIDRYLTPLDIPIQAHPGGAPRVTTMSHHRPLAAYVTAFAAAGFAVTALEEWTSNRASDSGSRARAENLARQEIPMFLALRAVHLDSARRRE